MCKVYGYARISTKQQNIERQVRNITKEFPEAIIIKEAFTGTKVEGRKEFEKLLRTVRNTDTIVFDSVSRMSRNATEGIEVYEDLYNRGVRLVFLKERHIDTDTYKKALADAVPMTGTNVDIILTAINEYLRILRKEQITRAFEQAQKEVDDLHQRTAEGIETARLNGKQIGQQPGRKLEVKKAAPAKKIIKQYSKSFGGDMPDAQLMKLAGISKPTLYKYKKEIIAEMKEAGAVKERH